MKTVRIKRTFQNDKQTLGFCTVFDEQNRCLFSGLSLERGWLDNNKNVSCVPKGRYILMLEYSPRFRRNLWELKNVPNRSECKFHSANYWYELNGCISLGTSLLHIDTDGFYDVSNSRNAILSFHRVLRDETRAEIIIE